MPAFFMADPTVGSSSRRFICCSRSGVSGLSPCSAIARVTGDPSLTLEISGSTQAPEVRLQGQKCPLQARDTQTGHWVLNWPCETSGSSATARPALAYSKSKAFSSTRRKSTPSP